MPVMVMPWIKRLRASKKAKTMGLVMSVAPAIKAP
jgi:hypothetical protein